MNESRPGVTSRVLSPVQALAYLEEMMEKIPSIRVVGIAGPGDPFANPYETMETLRLVRNRYPDMMLCLASNGLHIGPHIDELVELQVSHVTITMNAVDPAVGGLVYAWARDEGKILKNADAAATLIERQLDAVKRLAAAGILVKVNSIVVPGVNDRHIPEIAKVVKGLGATVMNCIPLCPVQDTPYENLYEPDGIMMARVRLQCGEHVSQMSHCARCRADAVGLLGEDQSVEFAGTLESFTEMNTPIDKTRPYIAVATQEGMLVNLHLGEANNVIVYSHERRRMNTKSSTCALCRARVGETTVEGTCQYLARLPRPARQRLRTTAQADHRGLRPRDRGNGRPGRGGAGGSFP